MRHCMASQYGTVIGMGEFLRGNFNMIDIFVTTVFKAVK